MPEFLNWNARPAIVQGFINDAYERVTDRSTSSNWRHNGASDYSFGISTDHLIMNMIEQQSATQETFFIMDIGAGDFQWGRALAKKINQHNFDNDMTVRIISIRGEKNWEPNEVEFGRCILHEIGSCQIEELETYFPSLVNQVDFIVSSWCFLHLVDPVGTLTQAYHLLKPKTGLFVFDGFFMQFEQYLHVDDHHRPMLCMQELLYNIAGSSFFTILDDTLGRMNVFVLQKNQNTSVQLPLDYLGYEDIDSSVSAGSTLITFRCLPEWQSLPPNCFAQAKKTILPRLRNYASKQIAFSWRLFDQELLDTVFSTIMSKTHQKQFSLVRKSHYLMSLFERAPQKSEEIEEDTGVLAEHFWSL